MISVAYFNDNHARLMRGRHYLESLGDYQVETFDNLKYSLEWLPFHSYDVIIVSGHRSNPGIFSKILSVLQYGDTTPVIIMRDAGSSYQLPQNITNLGPVIPFVIHRNLQISFFELHHLVDLVVSRQKITEILRSLDIVFKRSMLTSKNTVEENIKVVVETCGRCLSAIFVAYHRPSGRTRAPVAIWYAGELPFQYAMSYHEQIHIRSQKMKRGRFSSGWICSSDGRIEWAGKKRDVLYRNIPGSPE